MIGTTILLYGNACTIHTQSGHLVFNNALASFLLDSACTRSASSGYSISLASRSLVSIVVNSFLRISTSSSCSLLIRTGVTFFSIRASTYFASIPFLANTSSRGLAAPKMEEDAVVELLTVYENLLPMLFDFVTHISL